MFRQMRRAKQLLSDEAIFDVINRGTSGILSLVGDEGYPYGVPLNYCYDGKNFYFHSSKVGHKIDSIRGYDKASFTIVDKDEIVPEEFTSYFRSVIAFGKIRFLENPEEIERAMRLMVEKYSPDEPEEHFRKSMSTSGRAMACFVLEVEHITGKEAIELVKMISKMAEE